MNRDPSARAAIDGAAGALVILSANPIHDTGGGQRSAQIAKEFLARGYAVLFVSHGEVTETITLGTSHSHPRLVERSLREITSRGGIGDARTFLQKPAAFVVTQIPVREWLPVLSLARDLGAVCAYDLIDEWDSELGYGWYDRKAEKRVVKQSGVLVASAPVLQRYLAAQSGREVALLPNAFNQQLFSGPAARQRPADLPRGPIVLYVGSLWGKWMDWSLVDTMSRTLTDVSFVFVGDHRGEGKGLAANCHFLGLKAQADLAGYLEHAAVGMLPWTNDRVTQATSPLKVYEYLAMGLRVVSPELEPLRDIPGVVACRDTSSYIEAIRAAVGSGAEPELRQRMTSFAAAQSWDRRADALMDLVRAARSRLARPGLLSRLLAKIGL